MVSFHSSLFLKLFPIRFNQQIAILNTFWYGGRSGRFISFAKNIDTILQINLLYCKYGKNFIEKSVISISYVINLNAQLLINK